MQTDEWVLSWFSDNSPKSRDEVVADMDTNYLEAGWIDSLNLVTLITDAENQFDISFNEEEFQDESFATVKGLIDVIEEKRDGEPARSSEGE